MTKNSGKGPSAVTISCHFSPLLFSSNCFTLSNEASSIHWAFSRRIKRGFSWLSLWSCFRTAGRSSTFPRGGTSKSPLTFSREALRSPQIPPSSLRLPTLPSTLTKLKLRLDIKTNWRIKRFLPVPDCPMTKRGPTASPLSTKERYSSSWDSSCLRPKKGSSRTFTRLLCLWVRLASKTEWYSSSIARLGRTFSSRSNKSTSL